MILALKFIEPLISYIVSMTVLVAMLDFGSWGAFHSQITNFMHVNGGLLAVVYLLDFIGNYSHHSDLLKSKEPNFEDNDPKKTDAALHRNLDPKNFDMESAKKGASKQGKPIVTTGLEADVLESPADPQNPKFGDGSPNEVKHAATEAPPTTVDKWSILLKIEKRLIPSHFLRFLFQAALCGFFSFLNATLFLEKELAEPRISESGGAVLQLISGHLVTMIHVARSISRPNQLKNLRNLKLLVTTGLLCYLFYFFRLHTVFNFQIGIVIFVLLDSILFLILMVFVRPDQILARQGVIGLLLLTSAKDHLSSLNRIIIERSHKLFAEVFKLVGQGSSFKSRFQKNLTNHANKRKWTLNPITLQLQNPVHQALVSFTYNARGLLFRQPLASLVINNTLLLVLFALMKFAGVLGLAHLILIIGFYGLYLIALVVLKVLRRPLSLVERVCDLFELVQLGLLVSVIWPCYDIQLVLLLVVSLSKIYSRWPVGLVRFSVFRMVFLVTLVSKIATVTYKKNKIFLLLFLLMLHLFAEISNHYLHWEHFFLSKLSSHTKNNQHLYLIKCLKRLLPNFIVNKLLSRDDEKKKNDRSSTIDKTRRKPQMIQRFDQMKFLADDAGCVNILFCEICGLDITDRDNLEVLDIIYADFDRLSQKFGVQKIETVGKVYMACSGLQLFEEGIDAHIRDVNPYDRLFNFAVELHKHIDRFSQQLPLLKIKIGMHSGNCIYGFFGQHKPQFSLIGDSVNTASRHCKVSQPGLIVLSKKFYAGFSNVRGIIFKVYVTRAIPRT